MTVDPALKEPPRFRSADQLVQATLAGGPGNKSFVRFVADLPGPLDRDVDVLLALSVLRRKRTVDALVLAGVVQRSPADAQHVLQRMTEAHITEPTRRSAHHPFPTCRRHPDAIAGLGRALTYYRRQLDVADDKVLERIQEYGYITNRTVQRMFDVDVYRARNLLADMRARGLIAKIGEARGRPRGPVWAARSPQLGHGLNCRRRAGDARGSMATVSLPTAGGP